MLPPIVQRRVEYAQAVASNLRAVAAENPDLPTVAGRFTQAAQTIDELIALLESAAWVAKLNHDTIVESRNERADAV